VASVPEIVVEDRQRQLIAWCVQAQDLVQSYATCFAPVNKNSEPDRIGFVLNQLQFRTALTSVSVLKLVTELRLWDAEILLRTVVEGSLKFGFIASAPAGESAERTHEFLDALPEITSLKRHRRAQLLLTHLSDDDPQWRPIREVVLSTDCVAELEEKYPKPVRDALERKWGFTRMVESLAKAGGPYAPLSGLLYNYGMASHSSHLDGDAVLMMWERDRRPQDRLEAVELAHGARLIGDVLTFADFRTSAFYKFHGADTDTLKNVRSLRDTLISRLSIAHDRFHVAEYSEQEAEASRHDAT
jgi:hypothetical protein